MNKEVLSIYYTFEKACLIRVAIEDSYDFEDTLNENPLRIVNSQSLSELSLFEIPGILKNTEKTTDYCWKYSYLRDIDVWCNKHRSLEKILGEQFKGSLDLSKNNERLLSQLNNLIFHLKKSNKYLVADNVNSLMQYFDEALLIGIYGLYNKIFIKDN